MSNHPTNWRTLTIGEVASASKERGNPTEAPDSPYVGLEHIEKDTAKLVGKGTAAEVKSTKSVFLEGDLLYGKLRPYLNKVWIAEFDGMCSTDILVFPKTESIENKFLKYRFLARDFVNYANANSSGVNLPRVNLKALGKFEIDLPPVLEQRRIVARIEELFSRLDAGVAALRHAKAQLQRYRQSVLSAAVTGQLTQAWREQHPDTEPAEGLLKRILEQRRDQWNSRGKYKEPIGPISLNTHRIPESWSWSSADQLTEFVTDGEHQTPQRSDEGILLLSARNVHNGRLNLEKVDYVPEHEYERISKRLVVLEGDVLLSCSGSVGRTCVAPASPKFTLVRSVAVLRPILTMGKFMSCALQGPVLQSQIEEKKSQTAQANIFQGKIKTLTFPLPPLAEQLQIVAEVEARTTAIDHLEAELDRQLTRSNLLRQSTLAFAFTGKLTRSSDPN